jgi:hypothetical protein
MSADELWTQRDGTKIAVGDMSESHVRNALRMVLRNQRRTLERELFLLERQRKIIESIESIGASQDFLDARARDHRGMVFSEEHRYWYHPADRGEVR